jgi:hypothetical protein
MNYFLVASLKLVELLEDSLIDISDKLVAILACEIAISLLD